MEIKTSCSHSVDTSYGPNAVWGLFRLFSKSHSDLWKCMSKSLSHMFKILRWVGTDTTPPSQICHSPGPLVETPVLPLFLLVESLSMGTGDKVQDDFGVPRPTDLVCLCRQKWTSYSCSVWDIHSLCCQPSLQLSPVEKQCRGCGGKCHRPHPALSWHYNWHLQIETFNVTA